MESVDSSWLMVWIPVTDEESRISKRISAKRPLSEKPSNDKEVFKKSGRLGINDFFII